MSISILCVTAAFGGLHTEIRTGAAADAGVTWKICGKRAALMLRSQNLKTRQLAHISASPAGLTRGSIFFARSFIQLTAVNLTS
jgi:hypothetical protein